MNVLHQIAEQRIVEAMRERDLNSPKWRNRPLPLNDDAFVPDDLKMAYKILKNSGYLPPEIEDRKEVQRLEELIAATEDAHERLRQMKKLNLLLIKIDASRATPTSITTDHAYYRQVVERISLRSRSTTAPEERPDHEDHSRR